MISTRVQTRLRSAVRSYADDASRRVTSFGGFDILGPGERPAHRYPRPQTGAPSTSSPHSAGPRQFTGPRQSAGPRQFDGPRPSTGPRQFGGPRQFDGPRQSGGPRQFRGPRQSDGTTQFNGPRPFVSTRPGNNTGVGQRRKPRRFPSKTQGRSSKEEEDEEPNLFEDVDEIDNALYEMGVDGFGGAEKLHLNKWPEYSLLGPDTASVAFLHRHPVDDKNSRIPALLAEMNHKEYNSPDSLKGWAAGNLGGDYEEFSPYSEDDYGLSPVYLHPLRHASLHVARNAETSARLLHTIDAMVEREGL